MSLFNCPYCRACLQMAMEGTLDFIDGLIENNGCDHLHAMYENWQHNVDPGFFRHLRVPHFSSEESLDYYQGELWRY
ncbi:MAG: 2-hydroxyacyl-CoA dehydratase family protein [Actinomycetota bacterium]|nr:2-hydroxyacyl-CoA dehydratase family protein [Actinomycetota bacterium]